MLLAALTSMDSGQVSPDAALVDRLLHRDVSAFEDLYDRHSRIVYALVLRILHQASTAEEVVQDVFLQLWRNAGQIDKAPPLTGSPRHTRCMISSEVLKVRKR